MKKVILAVAALALTAPTFATSVADKDETAVVANDRKEVALSDLPRSVQATLSSDALKEFKAEKAVLVTGKAEGDVDVYEISGKQGDAQKTVKINANGEIVQ